MKSITALAILCFTLLSSISEAQELVIPKGYKLEEASDYAKYHDKIVEITRWLEVTPTSVSASKRAEAQAFLMKWVTGSPNVTITIRMNYMDLFNKNPELMTVFFGGWSSYVIEHPDDSEEPAAAYAAIESLLKAYQLDGVKKDKKVEKVLKMHKAGSLKDWITENMDE